MEPYAQLIISHLLSMMVRSCYLSPTSGSINVGPYTVSDNSQEIRKKIGYLPEQNPLYTEMTVYDYLKFVAEVREISDFRSAMKHAVGKCGLQGVVNKPINTLSKGYQQRVGLAQAIIHDPDILILDEPTTGLDPNQIVEIRELIKELGREKTLVISSHILQEVQAVCDRIVIINKGKIVADGSTEELQASFEHIAKLQLEIGASADDIPVMAQEIGGIKVNSIQTIGEKVRAELEYDTADDKRPALYEYIKAHGWMLWELHKVNISLEHVFRNLTIEGGE